MPTAAALRKAWCDDPPDQVSDSEVHGAGPGACSEDSATFEARLLAEGGKDDDGSEEDDEHEEIYGEAMLDRHRMQRWLRQHDMPLDPRAADARAAEVAVRAEFARLAATEAVAEADPPEMKRAAEVKRAAEAAAAGRRKAAALAARAEE
eukprot:SAG11_NODE_5574_length_1519_cov_2.300704_2_plen_149_part_01